MYGDLNSRCGDLHDYVDNIVYSEDINNIVSSDAVNEDNIRSRLSDNSIGNEYGRLIDLCITHDLLIVNGRTTSDPKGACTCYTHNGSSLVDYVLCSKSMIDRIDLKVEDINPLSDHCAVTTNISLNIPTVHSRNIPDIDYTCTSHTHIPYRWKRNFKKEYETKIESIEIKTQLDNIYDTLQEENSTPSIIKNSVAQLSSIIREASRKCSMYSIHTRQGRKICHGTTENVKHTETRF